MAEFDAQPGRTMPAGPARAEADELDLRSGLTGLAETMSSALGIDQMLGEVSQFALQAIPGADGVSISALFSGSRNARLQALAATHDFVGAIDTIQYDELREGPCTTSLHTRRPTVSGSLGSDPRWPRFGGRVARLGVHSALTLPMLVDGNVIGAINAYAHQRDAFGEHAVLLGAQFCRPAAVAVYNAQLLEGARARAQQLARALESRAIIDQAIGILRSRSGGSAEEAFERLTALSQGQQTKLHTLAHNIVTEAVRRAQARHT